MKFYLDKVSQKKIEKYKYLSVSVILSIIVLDHGDS